MAYGTVKTDTIIFDQGGADQNVTVSGIYRAITSGVTVSGTIAGAVLIGTTTVSGTTVTGTTANFASGVFTTQVSGATVTGTQSSFTSGNFVTLSGATATFTSGVIASGTAAAPSLSILGDPNTGIYSPGADQVAVVTNGTGRLVIDANGTVTCTSAQPTDGSIRISNTTTRAPSNKYGIRFADSASETNAAIYAEQASSGNNASALVFGTNGGTGGGVLTSAAERLRITSAGLVGVGTSSPSHQLDVVSAATSVAEFNGPANATVEFKGSGFVEGKIQCGGEFIIGSTNNYPVAFAANGTERLRIDSAGLVGIGTSSPGSALDVAGEIRIYPASGDANLRFGSGGVEKGRIAVNSSSNCIIETAGTERLRIDSSGRVGIGTTSPLKELQINATTPTIRLEENGGGSKRLEISIDSSALARIDATQSGSQLLFGTAGTERLRIDSSGNVGIGTTSPGCKIDIVSENNTSLDPVLRIYSNNLAVNTAIAYDGITGSSQFQLRTSSSNPLLFGTNNTERARIDSSGNVGIGTSSPSEKLDVYAGSLSVGSEYVSTLNTDYKIRLRSVGAATNNNYLVEIGVDGSGPQPADSDLTFSTQTYNGSTYVTTEKARLTATGRLGIGTTSPGAILHTVNTSAGAATVGAFIQNSSITAGTEVRLGFAPNANVVGDNRYSWIGAVNGTGSNDSALTFATAPGGAPGVERMRIDSAGALKASTNGTYKFGTGIGEITHNDATSTVHLAASSTGFTGDAVTIGTYRNTVNDSYKFLSCIRQGFAIALEIRDDGDVYNVNGTYGSLSDVKLKENIVDANSQWDDIRQLRVRNYNFKPETNNSTHKQIGVIAQEIEDVSPGLVNTVLDRDEDGNDLGTVTKSVNYSVLYMKAVKALQEAMVRIETLEARLDAANL